LFKQHKEITVLEHTIEKYGVKTKIPTYTVSTTNEDSRRPGYDIQFTPEGFNRLGDRFNSDEGFILTMDDGGYPFSVYQHCQVPVRWCKFAHWTPKVEVSKIPASFSIIPWIGDKGDSDPCRYDYEEMYSEMAVQSARKGRSGFSSRYCDISIITEDVINSAPSGVACGYLTSVSRTFTDTVTYKMSDVFKGYKVKFVYSCDDFDQLHDLFVRGFVRMATKYSAIDMSSRYISFHRYRYNRSVTWNIKKAMDHRTKSDQEQEDEDYISNRGWGQSTIDYYF
jgi:hypothetical protein